MYPDITIIGLGEIVDHVSFPIAPTATIILHTQGQSVSTVSLATHSSPTHQVSYSVYEALPTAQPATSFHQFHNNVSPAILPAKHAPIVQATAQYVYLGSDL